MYKFRLDPALDHSRALTRRAGVLHLRDQNRTVFGDLGIVFH